MLPAVFCQAGFCWAHGSKTDMLSDMLVISCVRSAFEQDTRICFYDSMIYVHFTLLELKLRMIYCTYLTAVNLADYAFEYATKYFPKLC